MYKVLVCGLTHNPGGMERVVYNFFKNMNRDMFHFDFICTGSHKIAFSEEFDKLSKNPIKYYSLPIRKKNPIKYDREIKKIFQKYSSEYDAVWVNALSLVNMKYIKYAKKYGIRKRIIHSHNTGISKLGIRDFIHNINKLMIKRYATDFWSCSNLATQWMYPQEIQNKVIWIKNAIDINEFLFDENLRGKYRAILNIQDDEILIGNVARIDPQKNQDFLLDVFSRVYEYNNKSKLILVGGGDYSHLEEKAEKLKIRNNIIFLGVRNDVSELYNIFDIFIFPSRFEGLGVALLEAQANGLPVLASDVIPKEVITNPNYYSLSLEKDNIDKWKNKILEIANTKRIDIETIENNFKKVGFEIKEESKKVEKLFLL